MEICLLGPLVVSTDGGPLAVAAQKERAACAALALRVGEVVSVGELLDALWGSNPPATAVKTLQGYISKLRRVLGAAVVGTERPGYRLRLPSDAVDLFRHGALVEQARQAARSGRPHEAVDHYAEAVSLWHGDPLPDLAGSEMGRGEIARLGELRLSVVEELLEVRLGVGDHHRVIPDLEALVVDAPLRERAWGLLMLALYRSGRQADALRAYQSARSLLIGQIGVEPGASLRSLEAAIIAQDPALELERSRDRPTFSSGTISAPASPASTARVADAEAIAPLLPSNDAWLQPSMYPFAGRDDELERLRAIWADAVTSARRSSVLIGGEPGIGKTRLVTEAAARVRDEGAVVLFGSCEEGLGAPYQPFVEALAAFARACPPDSLAELVGPLGPELTRLIPELRLLLPDLEAPPTADATTERLRLFEAVSELLERISARQPVLLVLDDLQWATTPTLLLLRHVLTGSRPARVLVAATYRPTDLDRVHPLADMLADLRRNERTHRVGLDGLDEQAAIALAAAAAHHDLDHEDAALVRRLHRECDGNPFFFWSMLTHLVETGTIVRRDGRWTHAANAMQTRLPEGIREVVARRLSSLGAETTEALHIAAVIGSTFDARVVAAVAEVSDSDALDAIDLACATGVVNEQPQSFGRFAFTHDLVRRSLEEELSTTRRARLHWRIVEVLTERFGDEADEHLDELARHATEGALAGDLAVARSIVQRAGDAALEALAFEEAAVHYENALGFVDQGDLAARYELLLELGRALHRAGNPQYRAVIGDAIAVARRRGAASQFAEAVLELHHNAHLIISAVHDAELRDLLQEGRSQLGTMEPGLQARLTSTLALTLSLSHERDRAIGLSNEALALARRSGQPRVLAQVLTDHSWAIAGPDTVDDRVALGSEALAISRRLNDHVGMINAFNTLTEAWLELGQLDRANEVLDEGLELARYLRRPNAAWGFKVHLASLAMLQTDVATVDARAEELLAVGTELGVEPGTMMAVYARLLLGVRYEQGRLDEAEAPLTALVDEQPEMAWVIVLGVIYVETGRLDEAAAILERLRRHPPKRDIAWAVTMMLATLVVAAVGDAAMAATIYDELRPFTGRNSHDGAGTCGPIDLALGRLAGLVGRRAEAVAHFETAAGLCRTWHAPMWAARTAYEHAALLVAAGGADDEQARDLLRSCTETARRTGQTRLLERALALGSADALT